MRDSRQVYRTANGSVYVEQADGSFLVIRPDGGTEVRFALPDSAQLLVTRRVAEEAAA